MEKELKLPKCTKGGRHSTETVAWVCFEDECRSDLLLCNMCIYENHKNHNIYPLKMILEDLPNQVEEKLSIISKFSQKNEQVEEIFSKLQLNSSRASSTCEDLIQQCINFKVDIRKFYDQLISQIEGQIPSTDVITKELVCFKESQFNYEKLKKAMIALLPISNYVDQDTQESSINPKLFCENVNFVVKAYDEKIQDTFKTIQKVMESQSEVMKEQLKQCTFMKVPKFKFQNFNTINVTYSDEFTKAKCIGTDYNFNIALLGPKLEQTQKLEFSYKVINGHSSNTWLLLGLFYGNKAKAQNYIGFPYSSLGNGAYLIGSDGYSYSDWETSKNNVCNSFHFLTNDIITCYFDGPKKTLKFICEQTKKEHFLTLQFKEDDELFPAVIFYYKNQEVEILQKAQKK